jgi:hypothetical protein
MLVLVVKREAPETMDTPFQLVSFTKGVLYPLIKADFCQALLLQGVPSVLGCFQGQKGIPFLDVLPNLGRIQLVLGKRGGKDFVFQKQVILVHFVVVANFCLFLWSFTRCLQPCSGQFFLVLCTFANLPLQTQATIPVKSFGYFTTTEAQMPQISIALSLRRPAAKPKHQAQVIDKGNSKMPAQNLASTQYHVSEPIKPTCKPSDQSPFLDHFAMQAENSYVPLCEKFNQNSKHTHMLHKVV